MACAIGRVARQSPGDKMSHSRCRKLVAQSIGIALASLCGAAFADEATGKVVWIDVKNSSLLLECPDKGCPQIPNSKSGETYTFVIPAKVKKKVASLKEGTTVTIVYDDGKDKGYVITAVNDK
jgi:hypothetical protein